MCSGLSIFSAKKPNGFTYLQGDELTKAGFKQIFRDIEEGGLGSEKPRTECLASSPSLEGSLWCCIFKVEHAELVFTANTMLSPEQSIRDELHLWWAQMGEITVNPFSSALAVISWAKITPFTPRLIKKSCKEHSSEGNVYTGKSDIPLRGRVHREVRHSSKGTCTQGRQISL